MSGHGTNKVIAPMVGRKFHRLTVVSKATPPAGRRGTFWNCRCECGTETVVYQGHLRSGATKGCGCARIGVNRTHGMSRTPEYRAWENARSRCTNPRNKRYPLYGGRGIRMCAEWSTSFEAFIAHMGRRPTKRHSLDRIDGDGHYEPGNCRWATIEEQNNNRPHFNRTLEVGGSTMTVAQASRAYGVPHGTILDRLDRGLSGEEAVEHG